MNAGIATLPLLLLALLGCNARDAVVQNAIPDGVPFPRRAAEGGRFILIGKLVDDAPERCLFLDVPLYTLKDDEQAADSSAYSVASPPRSGSTWFSRVIGAAGAHHYPFTANFVPSDADRSLVLIRNPFDAYRSYVKRRQRHYMPELSFDEYVVRWLRFADHHRKSPNSGPWVAYELIVADPRAALGAAWFDQLEDSLRVCAHSDWVSSTPPSPGRGQTRALHGTLTPAMEQSLRSHGYVIRPCPSA